MLKLLLTSSGITNPSIQNALEDLLGKPIKDSSALFVPTGVYPFLGGPNYAWWPIAGKMQAKLIGLGWKSMGLLELTALPSIDKALWQPSLQEADALLVWGGDPLYLAYWLNKSGVAELLESLEKDLVYVGVSAGAIAVSGVFAETYSNPPGGRHTSLSSEMVLFPDGITRNLITAEGVSFVEFAVLPHFENSAFPDACGANAALWASKLQKPVYAIDEDTALKVVNGKVEVISEGNWRVFNL